MDHTTGVQEGQQDCQENCPGPTRRPVEVRVNRVYSHRERERSTDINNNQNRVIIQPNLATTDVPVEAMAQISPSGLPMVSTCFAILQVALYVGKEFIGVNSEEDVYASWKTVITNREAWRLLYAHFFHFGRVHIFFNVVTLMALGRFLEKKIRAPAYALMIIALSAISNLLYIFLSDILCTGPMNEYTVGFSTAMFSLKMVHIFTMDSEANNGKGDPNLIFGFLPVHLPQFISPWQPVIEGIFFDIFVIGRCVAATVSGMLAGLLFPYLMKEYRDYIMHPINPPPPPPRYRSRHQMSQQSQNDNNNNQDRPPDHADGSNGNLHAHND